MNEIRRVGVVGTGVMGAAIAEVCARAGLDVLVAASRPASVATGRGRLASSLDRALRKGKLSQSERDEVWSRVSFTAGLADFGDRQLVIESVPEQEALKRDVFATLDRVAPADAILASNTSSLPIVTLGGFTSRPASVVGLHFFNPATVLPLVEVIPSVLTDADVLSTVATFAADVLGKEVVPTSDRSGFVVNALLIPYLLSAVRMYESGMATIADIDKAMTLGCAHPLGPFGLIDLIGLDTVAAIAESLYREYRESHYSPPPLLARMVSGGLLGKKTGRGFYDYDKPTAKAVAA